MLDMKKIRQNVEVVQKKLKTRGVDEEVLLRFLALDEERRALLVKVEELKKHRNQVSGEIEACTKRCFTTVAKYARS